MTRLLPCIVVAALLVSTDQLAARQAAPELADGPGKAVVVRVCGECHDAAARITKFKKTEAEWADTIADMQNRGMMADDKDLEVVLSYLTTRYGTKVARRATAHASAVKSHAHQSQQVRRLR